MPFKNWVVILVSVAAAAMLLCADQAWAATIHGKVLYGSKGVPNVKLTLVERSNGFGFTFVDPANVSGTTGPDGRFELPLEGSGKHWNLIAWDPFRPDKIGAQAEANAKDETILQVQRQLEIIEPKEYEVLTSSRIRIRWAALPDAVSYRVGVLADLSKEKAERTTSLPEVELDLAPGLYYTLSITAYDRDRIIIGKDVVHDGATHVFGISNPKVEREMQPMQADCVIAGSEPHLRVAPVASLGTQAPFMVSPGDKIRIQGKWGTWRKAKLVSGYFPGKEGWLSVKEVACPESESGRSPSAASGKKYN